MADSGKMNDGLASENVVVANGFWKNWFMQMGLDMTLNKHQSIRAGLCWIPEIAHLIRQHNNANVLVMPGRFIDEDMARKIMDEFFTTEFEGGRHQKRIDKIPV